MNVRKSLIYPTIPLLFVTLSFAQSVSSAHAQGISHTDIANSVLAQVISDTNNSVSHQNSGDNNNSSVTNASDSDVSATTTNEADVSQTVTAQANTGYNEASRNISIGGNAGIINTGNAIVNTNALVDVNTIETGVFLSNPGQPLSPAYVLTGDNNTDTTTQNSNQTIITRGKNNAVVAQTTHATATTGDNIADRNISLGGNAGVINTGDAGVITNYLIAANQAVMIIGGESDGDGPGSGASIISTGENSRYTSSSSRNSQLQLSTASTASVNQSCGSFSVSNLSGAANPCQAITGYNTADRNINRNGDAGVINTGDAILSVLLTTAVNDTQTEVTKPQGSASLASNVVSTGDNNSVDSHITDTTSASVSQNQQAQINQTTTAIADTGHNTANRNISFGGDAGVITTGNAEIYTRFAALANSGQGLISLLSSPQWGSN